MLTPPPNLPRAAVITALPLESDAVLEHLSSLRELVHEAGTIYRVGTFDGLKHRWEVATVTAGMHNVQAAIETERIIEQFGPSVVMFSGVAGGLKDVALGDVVAATKVYWYEAGKDEDEFRPRTEFGESSYPLVQRAMAVAQGRQWLERGNIVAEAEPAPQAFVKPIAAGAKVVAKRKAESYKLLRRAFSDAVAVDMESYGFLRAIYSRHGVQALAVRGISDLVQGKAEADAAGGQPRAARHAAAFAFQVLAELSAFPPKSGPSPQATNKAGEPTDLGALERIITSLYPRGPLDREVWSRAGGDIAQLQLTGHGRADWHSALRLLAMGGGGTQISRESVIAVMHSDFPNSPTLKGL